MKKVDMQNVQEHLQHVNTLDTDFLAEVIIAALIEQGVEYSDIQIVRTGESRACIDKDIESAELLYKPDNEMSDYLRVYVNRQGVYDILPEGLFFDGRQLPVDDIETMVQRIRENRSKEKNIRKFFSLYENEIDQTKVQTCPHTITLGQSHLGETLVLGKQYKDGFYDMDLIICDIPQQRKPDFLSEGKSRKIINEMIDLLFPADTKVEIKLKGLHRKMHLFDPKHPEERNFLGIDTYL